MPSVVKPLSPAEDIASGVSGAASDISLATLVSVTNMDPAPALVIIVETGNGIYVSPNGTVFIEKEPAQTLDAPAATTVVWASAIAYRA